MSVLKHYDSSKQKWVTDAPNAKDVELNDPHFVNANGTPVSASDGFNTVGNKLNLVDKEISWLYHNKGEGGTGGTTETVYTLALYETDGSILSDGNTIYTSSDSVNLQVLISGGSTSKTFTIHVVSSGSTIGTYSIQSLSKSTITIKGLGQSNNLEIYAVSGESQTVSRYINVVSGAIKITTISKPNQTIYTNSIIQPASFQVTNNTGKPATFHLECVGMDSYTTPVDGSYVTISSDVMTTYIQKIPGNRYYFTVYATAELNGQEYISNKITFNVAVVDATKLTLLLDGITTSPDGDMTDFIYGQNVSFLYYLSYANAAKNLYTVQYKVYDISGSGVETQIGTTQSLYNISTGINNSFTLNTSNIGTDYAGHYRIDLYAFYPSEPDNADLQASKSVYFKISESTNIQLTASNFQKSLYFYFSKITGIPSITQDQYSYNFISGRFPYASGGIALNEHPGGTVSMSCYGINNSTTGFINSGSFQGLRLSGDAHAVVNSDMFSSDASKMNLWKDGSHGFALSITFTADEASDNDDVILSHGKYTDGVLSSGIEITASKVTCAFKNVNVSTSLAPGKLTTVDIVGSITNQSSVITGATEFFVKIFINGNLTKVTTATYSEIFDTDSTTNILAWYFDGGIYIGCRNDNGVLSNYSNVMVHDIKLYTTQLYDEEVVRNKMSALVYATLDANGNISDSIQTSELSKNLFIKETISEGIQDYRGILYNYDTNQNTITYLKGNGRSTGVTTDDSTMLQTLITNIESGAIPVSLAVVNMTDQNDEFFKYNQAIFDQGDRSEIMDYKWNCSLTFYKSGNDSGVTVTSPDGYSSIQISLQGTSSLGYPIKNFEIYTGSNGSKNFLLWMKKEWLPESEYTWKADFIDSAHANNVVIGKIINGDVKDINGNVFSPLEDTPPMKLPSSMFSDRVNAVNGKHGMRHTSDGSQCIVFVKFNNTEALGGQIVQCMGIYNLNLGRRAYHNLGLKILTDFKLPDETNITTFPQVITDYTEKNYSDTVPTYSAEINQNNTPASFFQDDMTIVQTVADIIYASDNSETNAYSALQKFFNFTANFGLYETHKKHLVNGQIVDTDDNEYYPVVDPSLYTQTNVESHLDWFNAVSYYMIVILVWLFDSFFKNLTLRTWTADDKGNRIWYTCFYDMDSGFRKVNVGAKVVSYISHLNKYYNTTVNGQTVATSENHVSDSDYSAYLTRLQEIIENIPVKDNNYDGVDLTYVYVWLRKNILYDPKKFIQDQYISYVNNLGAAIYNYDYSIKYLQTKKTMDSTGTIVDSGIYSNVSMLSGTGTIDLAEEFEKRIFFLDGVYNYNDNPKAKTLWGSGFGSPMDSLWANNNAQGSDSGLTTAAVTMATKSQILVKFKNGDNAATNIWLNESPQNVSLVLPSGRQVLYIYGNNWITQFDGFNNINWYSIFTSIDFPLVKSLSLAGESIIGDGFPFELYDATSDKGLKSIKSIDFSNLTFSDGNVSQLNCSACSYLDTINISGSDIISVSLPLSNVLKDYNLSGTDITSLSLLSQAHLESLNISDCKKMTSLTLSKCTSLSNVAIPSGLETLNITGCSKISTVHDNYVSVNGSISALVSIILSNDNILSDIDLSGQNNQQLQIIITGCPEIKRLNLQGIVNINGITLPLQSQMNKLRELNISETNISYLNYTPDGQNPVDTGSVDISQAPDMDHFYAYNNSALKVVRCTYNHDNPIELVQNAFYNCLSLQRIYGNFIINGDQVFKGCSQFIINDDATYQTMGVDNTAWTSSGTNLTLDPALTTALSMFEGCTSLTTNDFRYMLARLTKSLTTVERMFKDCRSVVMQITSMLFANCGSNLQTIDYFLYGTKISGTIYSGAEGTFSHIPNITSAVYAFANTNLQWIDNNVFLNTVLQNVDYMFAQNASLKAAVDTTADVITEGTLDSKTFFINIKNLTDVYPIGMFLGCGNIKMNVNGNYLFHSRHQEAQAITSTFLSGLKLVGTIQENVFGSTGTLPAITLADGSTVSVYIPAYTVINSPFSDCNTTDLYFNLSDCKDIFNGISTLTQIIYPFKGLNIPSEKSMIPPTLLNNGQHIISVKGLFSDLGLTNNNQDYVFPTEGFFDNCTSLQDISSILEGNHDLHYTLAGDRMKNCRLVDVSNAFARSGLYGTIPFHLFYMENAGTILHIIDNMSGVFAQCWYLGYDDTRRVETGVVIDKYGNKTRWDDHIISVPGNQVLFNIPVKDSNDPYSIDGNPVTGGTYYNDDIAMQSAILEQSSQATESFYGNSITYRQNYIIPSDLFRYCSKINTLSNVLDDLTYYRNYLVQNTTTGFHDLITDYSTIQGMAGRIPPKLFDDLIDTKVLNGVFESLKNSPYIGYRYTENIRGQMYPSGLFSVNVNLTTLQDMFAYTIIPIGIDVSGNLFINNTKLLTVSGLWKNCRFDARNYVTTQNNITTDEEQPQIPSGLFDPNTLIQDASYMFAVTDSKIPYAGLRNSNSLFLSKSTNIINVDNMFYYNSYLASNVPEFSSTTYTLLQAGHGYVKGANQGSIPNYSNINDLLKPLN